MFVLGGETRHRTVTKDKSRGRNGCLNKREGSLVRLALCFRQDLKEKGKKLPLVADW